MDAELHTQDLKGRYRAAVEADGTVLASKWPLGCRGAANAFLALIGPSMGRARSGETPERGGVDRPYLEPMRIGRDVMSFDWGDHRKIRWTQLCSEMLGGEQYVRTLTALLNLDWRHSSSEKEIPDENLLRGFTRFVWPLLGELRPRLVCPLTNRVWNTILPQIEALRTQFPRCAVPLPREPIFFRLPGSQFPTMLIKPHNHPSRPLSNEQISEVGRACKWLLSTAVS